MGFPFENRLDPSNYDTGERAAVESLKSLGEIRKQPEALSAREALTHLEKTLAETYQQAEVLRSRLESVLRPAAPGDAVGAGTARPSHAPMVEQIVGLVRGTQQLGALLRDIDRRLDL